MYGLVLRTEHRLSVAVQRESKEGRVWVCRALKYRLNSSRLCAGRRYTSLGVDKWAMSHSGNRATSFEPLVYIAEEREYTAGIILPTSQPMSIWSKQCRLGWELTTFYRKELSKSLVLPTYTKDDRQLTFSNQQLQGLSFRAKTSAL